MIKNIIIVFLLINTEAYANPMANFGFFNKKTIKNPPSYSFLGRGSFSTVITSDGVNFYATGGNDTHQLSATNAFNFYRYGALTRTGIKSFEGSRSNSCIIDSNDTVQCRGKNSRGESALGNFNNFTPGNDWFITSVTNVVHLSGADGGSPEGGYIAIKSDGSVYGWGYNDIGRFLTGDTNNINTPLQIVAPGSSYVQGALGAESMCLRTSNGKVFCAGMNTNGQLGDSTNVSRNTFAEVVALSPYNIVDLKAGSSYYCAKTDTGDLYCWGYNSNGQIANGATTFVTTPFLSATGVSDFKMGVSFTMYLKDGNVYFAGANTYGQFGFGTTSNINSAFFKNTILPDGQVAEINTGSHHSCVRLVTNRIFCAGNNGLGSLGNGSQRQFNSYKEITYP